MRVQSSKLRIMVLFLAAGRGRRYGEDKRRVMIQPGVSLLQRSLAPYQLSGLDIKVALSTRAQDDEIAAGLEAQGLQCLRCDRADEGMGVTISQCVAAFENADALFVALADMPLLQRSTLDELQRRVAIDRIVYPMINGRRGHPVLFGKNFFSLLAELSGDRGGASLISRYPSSCIEVSVDDPGVLFDIDTPADMHRLGGISD